MAQFPSWIKLRKPRGPPLWADAVAKVDIDLAAATVETNSLSRHLRTVVSEAVTARKFSGIRLDLMPAIPAPHNEARLDCVIGCNVVAAVEILVSGICAGFLYS